MKSGKPSRRRAGANRAGYAPPAQGLCIVDVRARSRDGGPPAVLLVAFGLAVLARFGAFQVRGRMRGR